MQPIHITGQSVLRRSTSRWVNIILIEEVVCLQDSDSKADNAEADVPRLLAKAEKLIQSLKAEEEVLPKAHQTSVHISSVKHANH